MRGTSVAALLVLTASCGRLGFDPISGSGDDGDGGVDAMDVGYFLSPAGSDANEGTRGRPWLTFSYAFSRLVPGDTLNLLDGKYRPLDPSGFLAIDCDDPICSGANCPNGTASAPIRLRADHSRGASIEGDGSTPAVLVDACSYWDIEGLVASNADRMGGARANTILIDDSDHINLRDLIGSKPNRFGNFNVIEINGGDHVLLEDSEVYDFHEAGVALYKSVDLTVRRVYINGRHYPDVGGGRVTTCTQNGDRGLSMRYVGRTLAENVIVENACDAFAVFAGEDTDITGDNGWGDNNTIRGSVALGNVADLGYDNGFEVFSDCGACNLGDEVTVNTRIEHSVAIGFQYGVWTRGVNTVLDHVTSIQSRDFGIEGSGSSSGGWGIAVTSSSVVTSGIAGYHVRLHTNWGVSLSNAFGSGLQGDYDTMGNVFNSTMTNPAYSGCLVYAPTTSPLYPGVGADLRSVFPGGGFPCGAVVPGVNGEVTDCRGVSLRLNVGAGGCPAP